jgi:uncharacterized protein
MSPRPIRLRKISNPPVISGFKPYGGQPGTGEVFLQIEEYEAIRLCDFEMLNHHQASSAMNVSRPTLTRIYSRARQKIASALVEGKQLIIEGGKIYFDSEWFTCDSCNCFFNQPEKDKKVEACPLCGSSQVANYQGNPEGVSDSEPMCDDLCVCPECGFTKKRHSGNPCRNEVCPDCGKNLTKKEQ